jgi:hypothetical protein
MGACAMLPRIIGQGRAAELLYTGRVMTADEGQRWGFWNALYPAETLEAEALALAARLAAGPTFAHSVTKTQLVQEWDMGLMAARNLPQVKGQSPVLIAYAVLGPIVHAALALGVAAVLKLSPGDGALLIVLAASASYIAVPAVLRTALPEAKPALYFGLSLGLTFPLNIVLGIPIYLAVAQLVLK